LGPADFLAVAEKSGLLQAVDAWVLQQAMQTLGRWRAQGWWADRWRLSVNLTAIDLQQENFLPQLRGQLQSLSVPAELLEFELNEGALIRPTSAMLELLRDLRQLGLALSIDDFGTGYSSLAYLKQLPVSEIKIDRSFVADMLDNESNQAVVEAIISVAQARSGGGGRRRGNRQTERRLAALGLCQWPRVSAQPSHVDGAV